MAKNREQKLREWYIQHAGVVPLKVLIEFGYSQRSVYRMVERKELIILQPGVFQSSLYPAGELQRQIAACMRSDDVSIGFLTAARMWKFRQLPKDRLLHVVIKHGKNPVLKDVIVHRSRSIDEVDIVEFDNGLRVTSPPRTLFDIAPFAGDITTGSILEQLIHEGKGTITTHTATLARLGDIRRPSTAVIARVIKSRSRWSQALQSDLEVRVLAEMRRQGLPDPVAQHTIVVDGGHRIRFDFAWPDRRVALEVDHPFWHAGDEQTHSDKWRDRKAGVVGWDTKRVTSLDVEGGLRDAITDIKRILERAPLVA